MCFREKVGKKGGLEMSQEETLASLQGSDGVHAHA